MSLSYDELFSVYFAEQGPHYLLSEGWQLETNPPLYFLLLDGWIALFGDSAAAVRSLSLLASAATLPVVFRIARSIGLRDGAWLAAALTLTSALDARYALMARPYALWLFVLALALLALTEAIMAATPVQARRWALGFAGAGLVALYLHDATLVFLAAADAVFVLEWLWRRRSEPQRLVAWALPQLLMAIAGAPQLLVILAQRNSANIAWIPPVDPAGLSQAAIELLSGHEFPFGSFQGPALLLTVLLVLILVPLRAPRAALPLAGLALLGLALLLGAGILLPRTALWLLLPLALLQAAALTAVRTAWLRAGLIGLALGLGALDTAFCLWEYQPEPWQDFLATLEAERQPGDVLVLLNGAPATALRYYQAGAGAALYRWDATAIDGPGTAVRALDDRVLPLAPIGEIGIRNLLQQGRAVWLISRLRAQFEPEAALAAPFAVTRRLRQRSVQLIRLAPP